VATAAETSESGTPSASCSSGLWPTAVCTSRGQSPPPRFASARSTLAGLARGEALFISLVREVIYACCLSVWLLIL
jgi:hypothetical protein